MKKFIYKDDNTCIELNSKGVIVSTETHSELDNTFTSKQMSLGDIINLKDVDYIKKRNVNGGFCKDCDLYIGDGGIHCCFTDAMECLHEQNYFFVFKRIDLQNIERTHFAD